MLRGMMKSASSPIRNSYNNDRMLSASEFFSPLSPRNDVNEGSHCNDPQTPLSISRYNTNYKINKELQQIIGSLRCELTEKREYFTKMNEQNNELQCKYNDDMIAFHKKLEHVCSEKHELMKDLDLALEREQNAMKRCDDKIKASNDMNDILNYDMAEYQKQIKHLRQSNEEIMQNVVKTMQNLSNQGNDKRMKALNRWMMQLPQQIYAKHIDADLPETSGDHDDFDWNCLQMRLCQISKNIAAVIAERERVENEFRIKLENEVCFEQFRDLETANIALHAQNKRNEIEMQLMNGSNHSLNENMKNLVNETQIIMDEKNKNDEMMKEIMNENEDLKKKNDALSVRVSDNKQNIESITKERDECLKQIKALKAMKKHDIMSSYILQKDNALHIETDDSLQKEVAQCQKKLLSAQSFNALLKEKFQTNKKNTIIKYEQIGMKVAAMRDIITSRDDELKSLRKELDVSHKQFFKLLHDKKH